jgi:hypothetical protein
MGNVGYHLDQRKEQNLSRLFNETVAQAVKQWPRKFVPVATVPMQSTRAAIEELEYAVKSLNMRMVEIGTNINGVIVILDQDSSIHFLPRLRGNLPVCCLSIELMGPFGRARRRVPCGEILERPAVASPPRAAGSQLESRDRTFGRPPP